MTMHHSYRSIGIGSVGIACCAGLCSPIESQHILHCGPVLRKMAMPRNCTHFGHSAVQREAHLKPSRSTLRRRTVLYTPARVSEAKSESSAIGFLTMPCSCTYPMKVSNVYRFASNP